MSEDWILSVRDLKTHFFTREGVVRAVDGVGFDLAPGRVLGIVGESGCGKSVTALSILGIVDHPGRIVDGRILLRPAHGDTPFDLALRAEQGDTPVDPPVDPGAAHGDTPVDLARLDPTGRQIRSIRGGEIALIFQEPMASLSPVHTIGQQISETIRLHRRVGRRRSREQAVEVLRSVGVPDPEEGAKLYPFQLSGGLRQRALIAQALAGEPRVLIADEPTTALDVTTQAQILDLLRDLQKRRGMAIILITHDLGVIAEMADEVLVMYLGKGVERAPVDLIFHSPEHPYTRALLNSMPGLGAAAKQALPSISGTVPPAFRRPAGCSFHPRCLEFLEGTCNRREPEPVMVRPDQEVLCLRREPEEPSQMRKNCPKTDKVYRNRTLRPETGHFSAIEQASRD